MMITIILIILSKKKIVPNMDTAKKSYILHYKKSLLERTVLTSISIVNLKRKKNHAASFIHHPCVLHWNHDMRDDE